MRLQLLSDLHLETEAFDPVPAPGAELLVLDTPCGHLATTSECEAGAIGQRVRAFLAE